MPPKLICPACEGKWAVVSGGLCAVCRSLDRLAAYCRGPQFPPATGEALLPAVRTWIGEAQDLSETLRGVVPCPKGVPPKGEGPEDSLGLPGSGEPPQEPGVEGATPKAAGLPPVSPAKEESPGGEEPPEPALRSSGPSSSHRARRSPKRSASPRSPKKDKRKRSRKSRSRRRGRHRSRSGWASPVRPSGVKSESSPERDAERSRRKKARPRTPSVSPPDRPPLPRHPPSHRPVGAQWVGPIRAPRREPPPGQGRHFQKNKGVSKRKRNREYWRGAGRGRRR